MQVSDAAGFGDLAGDGVADQLGQLAGDGQQAGEVDAGVVTHGVQHVDRVFAADVAAGAWRVGATAQAAE